MLSFSTLFCPPGLSAAETAADAETNTDDFIEGLDPDAAFLARISGLFSVEDPASVYDFSIDDREVEFILDGSWEVKLDSSLAIGFSTGTPVYGFTPPVFSQSVDLTSWVFLDNTWYFESSFAEEFTRNTVAAGYVGNDETVVRHVRLGNSGIVFPSGYPFVDAGGGTAIAPGVMGTFAGERWNADAIVRYDAAASDELLLSGMNEVTDTLVPVTSPLRGKWFVLPDAPVTGSVSVYEEDASGAIVEGNGRRWRKLDSSEFTVSGLSGVIELDEAATGSVAVRYGSETYPALGAFVDDTRGYFESEAAKTGKTMPSGFLDASRFLLALDGGTALLVRDRSLFSPFEALMRYLAEGSEYELVYAESGARSGELSVVPYGTLYAEVFRGTAGYGSDIRTSECRYPLAREFPYLYLPASGGMKIDTDLSVRSRAYTPVTSISLGNDVIAGTIQVTRNGVADTAFRFDEESGILELDKMPLSSETIKITWLKTDQSARNATLTVAGGFKWRPVEPLELSLASALRWNTAKDGYTDSGDTSPGSYVVSTGAAWKGNSMSASTSFAFEVQVPDTTGFYRMLGMDSSARTFYPDPSWYKIPSPSVSPSLGLPANESGISLDASRYVAGEGTEGTAPATVTESSVSGSILALRAQLKSADAWTGACIETGTKGGADLSAARTLSLALKNSGASADFDVYLQLGVVSGNEWENPDSVRTWKLATPEASSRWKILAVELGDEDRRALGSGSDIRLLVVPSPTSSPSDSNPVTVSLFSGPVEIAETGFGAEREHVETAEIRDPLTGEKALSYSASSIINRFNAGGLNTVLEVSLSPETVGDEPVIVKTMPPVPISAYRNLSFFLCVPEGLPESSRIVVRLDSPSTDGNGTACALELSPAALGGSSWHRVTLDLETENISVDGAELPVSAARTISLDRSVSPTRIAVSFVNWPVPASGTAHKAYLDEFFLEESSPVRTARNETAFEWNRSGAILSVARFPVLSNPELSVRAVTSSVIGSPDLNAGGTAKAGISLFGSRIDGSVGVSNATDLPLRTESHTVSVPFGPLSATEQFATDFTSETLSREDALALKGPVSIGATLSESQKGRTIERKAGFSLVPSIPETGIGSFGFSADAVFAQTGASPYPEIADRAWTELWKESFDSLLSVGENDASKRSGASKLRLSWEDEDLAFSGLILDGEAKSAYEAGSATTIGSEISFGLSAPLRFESFTLTPKWSRLATEKKPVEAGGSWVSDSETLATSFGNQSWLVTVFPVADLFDSSIASMISGGGLWSRTFANAYGVDWQRPSPGILSDLWIPSTASASVKRETATDASALNVRDIWSAQAKAGFSALNVAGTKGVLRAFPWYEQDEISQLYGWTTKWGKGYFIWSLDTWHSVTLFFPDSGSLSCDNTWHYDAPDMAGKNELARDTVRVVWKRPGKDSLLVVPLARLTELPVSTRREDSSSLAFSFQKKTRSTAFSYDHLLATGIGKNAEVRLSAGTGFSSTQDGLQTVEIRLGVGGKLTY